MSLYPVKKVPAIFPAVIMSSLEDRFAALEARVAELAAENELLKMQTPLEAFTEGLKAADEKTVAAWMDACQIAAGLEPKKAKKGEKKAPTNPTGPQEWNIFVKETQKSMAAAEGVLYESFFEGVDHSSPAAMKKAEDAFNKASGAKKAGWRDAMLEAKVRKAAAEGRQVAEKKSRAPKAAPAAAGGSSAPKKAKKAAAPSSAASALDQTRKEAAELGLEEKVIDGAACWLALDGEVYSLDLETRLGVYDADADTINASE
jgi:hypothetical protein